MNDHRVILCLIQTLTLWNARRLGWEVKKIDDRTFELSKDLEKIKNLDIQYQLNRIMDYKA